MAVSAHYVHKQLDRAVEDTGSLDADGNEIYIIANPSEGLDRGSVPRTWPCRSRSGSTTASSSRSTSGWRIAGRCDVSYLLSRLYGNYSGLSQSDENGRTSPNVGRGYDYPSMMFTGGGTPCYGRLATDRPHQFKAQAIYQLHVRHELGPERVRRERRAGHARSRRAADQQLPGAVPRERGRWPDADVLADGHLRPARVQARNVARSS